MEPAPGPTEADLERDYAAAFAEWDASEDAELWDLTTGAPAAAEE